MFQLVPAGKSQRRLCLCFSKSFSSLKCVVYASIIGNCQLEILVANIVADNWELRRLRSDALIISFLTKNRFFLVLSKLVLTTRVRALLHHPLHLPSVALITKMMRTKKTPNIDCSVAELWGRRSKIAMVNFLADEISGGVGVGGGVRLYLGVGGNYSVLRWCSETLTSSYITWKSLFLYFVC